MPGIPRYGYNSQFLSSKWSNWKGHGIQVVFRALGSLAVSVTGGGKGEGRAIWRRKLPLCYVSVVGAPPSGYRAPIVMCTVLWVSGKMVACCAEGFSGRSPSDSRLSPNHPLPTLQGNYVFSGKLTCTQSTVISIARMQLTLCHS